MLKYAVCLCRGCDGCCVFCLYCEAWNCRCSCMGSVSVSSCRCCMVVSRVHPVAVLNAVFCLPHPVSVSAFMICRDLCACTEMLWMCVLYVSFGSKVRPITFGCVAMDSALLFIVRFRLLIYSAGSGVNRVQVVLSGFSKRLFCFVQAKTLCRYGCMYFLATLVLVCVCV